jgi:hypothetical protein
MRFFLALLIFLACQQAHAGTIWEGTELPRTTVQGANFGHPEPHGEGLISVHMTRDTGVSSTIAVSVSKGDRDITLTDATGFAVGNKVQILDDGTFGNLEYDFFTIKAISVNTLTLDRVVDLGHDIGEEVKVVSQSMKVLGSAASPVTFCYTAPIDERVHIHSVHIVLSSSTEPSLERFGGIGSLAYGVHFYVKNDTGRNVTYWVPIRSNNSFRLSGFLYEKEDKVLTTWFSHFEIDLIEESYSVINLEDSQQFCADIQDDLTTLLSFEIKLGIHIEENE